VPTLGATCLHCLQGAEMRLIRCPLEEPRLTPVALTHIGGWDKSSNRRRRGPIVPDVERLKTTQQQ
jgi:hypothetical protein